MRFMLSFNLQGKSLMSKAPSFDKTLAKLYGSD